MKQLAILLGAGVLSIGLSACATDGYYGGADYGYGYGSAYNYGVNASGYERTCLRRERVLDPYTGRTMIVRRAYPC